MTGFFRTPAAARLDDPDNLAPALGEFLQIEHRCVRHVLRSFDVLVEIGCGSGRHLDAAAATCRGYWGIDVEPRNVEAGNARLDELGLVNPRFGFRVGTAESFSAAVPREFATLGRALVLFPFSVLSAIPAPDPAAAELQAAAMPFLATMYGTSDRATAARVEYYGRCGYEDVRVERSSEGVRLTTAEGLTTTAYSAHALQRVWDRAGLPATSVEASDVVTLSGTPDVVRDALTVRAAAPLAD